MHATEKSDEGIVPEKLANKGWQQSAEPVEERPSTKRNTQEELIARAQSRSAVSTRLERVRQRAVGNPDSTFNNLYSLLTPELLYTSFFELNRNAATGIDGVSWREYREAVEGRIADLHGRLHRGSYRATPSRRSYIEKSDGRLRPLGISSLEDKIVQQACVAILNQIYDSVFIGFSYGFRRGKCQHDALDALSTAIYRGRINWALDADIQGFFDNIPHDELLRFIEKRVSDPRLLRLVTKWLKCGWIEDDERYAQEVGTPQGSVISPFLGNIYLHYVLDAWTHQWRKTEPRGNVIIVRYADDFVVGFQHEEDAHRYVDELTRRMQDYGLTLHPEKTRLLEFGPYALEHRKRRGEGKPKSFDFLGFTHSCGKTSKGRFTIKRKTARKRMASKLAEVKLQLRKRMHRPLKETGLWLRSVLIGHCNYYGVPWNSDCIRSFHRQVEKMWLASIRRRSQKGKTWTWERFARLRAWLLPSMRIVHPYPEIRFDVKHSR